MAGPQEIQNSLLSAGFARMAKLCSEGNVNAALAEAMALYERFPHAPAACTGLIDTLLVIGQTDMAETVLRRACRRFPAEAWLSLRLAELATQRGRWAEAAGLWRAAGLPDAGTPSQLARFAMALAANGDTQEALQVAAMPGRDSAALRLTRATLLAQAGRTADAIALWPELAAQLTLADPEFARLTALLAEPDPGDEAWRPAIAAAMAHVQPGDAACAQVLAALPSAPSGTARSVAARLAGEVVGPDQLALQISTCVAAGRVGLLPLLLETPGTAVRTAQLRVALRLYLNRAFANPQYFDELSTESACVLLQIARVADPACFHFVAELARTRFAPVPLPDWSLPGHIAATVAHARPSASPAPAGRLRVAICIHGRISATQPAIDAVRALGLQDHDATVFAQLWRMTSRPPAAPGLDAVLQPLPPKLRAAFAAAAEMGGQAGLRRLYPSLLQGWAPRDEIDVTQARRLLQPHQIAVLDDAQPEFAGWDAAWKTSLATRMAHRMAGDSGQAFDLIIHLAADSGLGLRADWPALAHAAHAEGVMFANTAYQFDRAAGFSLAPQLAIGAPATMDLAAASFDLGAGLAQGRTRIHGVRPQDAMRQGLAWQMHLHGVAIEPLDSVLVDAAALQPPLSPTAALALLWQDIRARRPASPDSQLVNAAMADLTFGVHA